ncbi:MAG: hypothetical protein WDO73_36925 [Ignavibacteriota bacterium]
MKKANPLAPGIPWLASLAMFAVAVAADAQEIRPGVWGGQTLTAFPLPAAGYDVYMIGELHGVKENAEILMQYTGILYERAGLRDIALEEKPAYEADAQAYIEGRRDTAPRELCLRAEVLAAMRRFNEGRKAAGLLHVHLVDIDINPEAIREHLYRLKRQIAGAEQVSVPRFRRLRRARWQRWPRWSGSRPRVNFWGNCERCGIRSARTSRGFPWARARLPGVRTLTSGKTRLWATSGTCYGWLPAAL